MDAPDLLTRVSNVCNYYRGASWQLAFDSGDGGFWSLRLTSPPEADHQPEATSHSTPFGLVMSFGAPADYPIFAMRCQSLEVVAESLEHWHASVLSRETQ